MKFIKITFILAFISNLTFGQNIDYESKVINQYKKERQNQLLQKKIVSDISGVCDAITTATNQNAGIGWDECMGIYEGTIEFKAFSENGYNVYSVNDNGTELEDMSFGSYYYCYGEMEQSSMPNGDNQGSLLFNVDDQGNISFTGASQWGEVYFLDNVVTNGPQISFQWENDYGEGAQVELNRQDGQSWDKLLSECNICSESDSLALIALYNATDGPNWIIKWDLETPVRDWYGVTLNSECRVSEIELGPSSDLLNLDIYGGNNLVNEIPSELIDLSSSLTFLDLASNSLEGDVLPIITQLENLKFLNLRSNSFGGSIPAEIENLQKLEFVSLSINEFEGTIPSEFSTISPLRILFSSSNNLEGEIPVEFGQFENLNQLSMWGNYFEGPIPVELGNIDPLVNLTLDYNNLSGEIPSSIAQLPNLNALRLSYNQLSGSIPEGFSEIAILQLNNNNFSGIIPPSLASNSVLTGVNPVEVNLTNNNFTGEIPHWLVHNIIDQAIYFDNNDFTGCMDNIENICVKTFNPGFDTINVNGEMLLTRFSSGYNCTGNPKLAWQGDYQLGCDGTEQIGAPCDDGDEFTEDDVVNENCDCLGKPVSTKDIEELNSISIVPNPILAGESFNINLELNARTNLNSSLIDINGKVQKQQALGIVNGTTSFSIDTKELSPGLYILQIASENGIAIKRVIIN